MKTLIKNYTFNAASKQITFIDYTSINLDAVLLITNVTDNLIIYNFASVGSGGTVAGNVLTLSYNTTGMSNTDNLQIFYDDTTHNPSTEEMQSTLNDLTITLNELVSRLNVIASMANSGAPALRVNPIASVSTAVTGSVTATVASTVASDITLIGTIPATPLVRQQGNLTAEIANIKNVTP